MQITLKCSQHGNTSHTTFTTFAAARAFLNRRPQLTLIARYITNERGVQHIIKAFPIIFKDARRRQPLTTTVQKP